MVLRGPNTLAGGVVTLNNADSLIQVAGACTIDNDLTFSADSNSGKGLDFDDNVTISGDITMSADPIFDFAANKVLYQGAAVDVSANTLTFLGTGTFDNSGNNFNLNRGDSLIKLSGSTVSNVSQTDVLAIKKSDTCLLSSTNKSLYFDLRCKLSTASSRLALFVLPMTSVVAATLPGFSFTYDSMSVINFSLIVS